MSYELPPQARGSAEEQLAALRDYLVRLAQELERVEHGGIAAASKSAAAVREKNELALREQAAALKALIIKNADEITSYADERFDSLSSTYLAVSDFGTYLEQIDTSIRQTARDTVESYRYAESIRALESYVSVLNGQIRRGLIENHVDQFITPQDIEDALASARSSVQKSDLEAFSKWEASQR